MISKQNVCKITSGLKKVLFSDGYVSSYTCTFIFGKSMKDAIFKPLRKAFAIAPEVVNGPVKKKKDIQGVCKVSETF